MSGIERHSRWLLLAYPRWYREDRGDEMVDTLLESAGADQAWPAFRDTRALILAGLRVRAGRQQRPAARVALTQALLLAAVLMLVVSSARSVRFFQGEWGHTFPSTLFAPRFSSNIGGSGVFAFRA